MSGRENSALSSGYLTCEKGRDFGNCTRFVPIAFSS